MTIEYSDCREKGADAMRLRVGQVVGNCKECGGKVIINTPMLSKFGEILNWFRVHCTNDNCQFKYGIDITDEEWHYIRFVDFSKEANEKIYGEENIGKIICFSSYVNKHQHG